MTDKRKEEWEIGSSRENASETPTETKTVNFQQPETLVGQMLDNRFLIEKDLTEGGADAGGIGLVYLAKDMKLMGRETVVKILQKALLENEDIARKFQHEKEALIRLDHPNIVRILDSGYLSDGNPFMVMEYITGYSLRRKLRETEELSLEYCSHIIESVSNALAAVHAQQILHRDIKPENIMLTPEEESFERVRLIDFGIARVENSKLAAPTEIERAIGTILYMAPEQLAGKIEQTPAVDIYALAIVAYEILTGKMPFKPRNIVEMHVMQMDGVKISPTDIRPDLPDEAEKILLSALAFDPNERPQNMRIFGRNLANALRSNPVSIAKTLRLTELAKTAEQPKPITTPEIDGTTNKNKWLLPVITFLGLILLAFGIFIAVQFLSTDDTPTANIAANTNTNAAEKTTVVREMRYWLEVQKKRGERKFGAPFEATGREIFENDYELRLNFIPPDDGYFYLFNEGKDSAGKVNYNMLYPTLLPGKESAKTEGEKTIQTDWSTFSGTAGTEKFWLVWTKDEQDVLKDAKNEAFNQIGKVADFTKEEALRKFLDENSKQKFDNQMEKDEKKKRTILTGEGDKIVYLLELEHR